MVIVSGGGRVESDGRGVVAREGVDWVLVARMEWKVWLLRRLVR